MISETIHGRIKGYCDLPLLMHHVGVILILGSSLINGKFGRRLNEIFLLGEISNPPLNLAMLFETLEFPTMSLYSNLAFMTIFLGLRPTLGYAAMVELQTQDKYPLILKVLSTFFVILSLFWAWDIVNKAAKILSTVSNFGNFSLIFGFNSFFRHMIRQSSRLSIRF